MNILQGNEAHVVISSYGYLYIDEKGKVLRQETEGCPIVDSFDIEEYKLVWRKLPEKEIDILDLKGTLSDGSELLWTTYQTKRRLVSLENAKDLIELINEWCNDHEAGDDEINSDELIRVIQSNTQDWLDKV